MILQGIAAFLIAALSGMGVGGGGLFVIYLALVTDLPQLTVQGMNLLFFLFSAGSSMIFHLSSRRICWRAVGWMTLGGLAGAFLGTLLSRGINQELLRRIFGGMLVVSGILSLQGRGGGRRATEKEKS